MQNLKVKRLKTATGSWRSAATVRVAILGGPKVRQPFTRRLFRIFNF
jgi:hypothetical protein